MNRLLIQPDTVENRILIFLTAPEELLPETTLDAKVKKVVLYVLFWIVNILTLGIITRYCTKRRWVLESQMQKDMIKQLPVLIKEAVTIAMTRFMNTISLDGCSHVIKSVENELKKVDGLSDNVRDYILSLIPIERLKVYAGKQLSHNGTSQPLTSFEIEKYVKVLVEEVRREVIYGRTSLDRAGHLCPKTAREREDLYIFVHMSANFHLHIDSIQTEKQPIERTPDHLFVTIEHLIDQIKEVLDCFWFEFHSARPEGRDGIKQDYLAILPQIEGVSEKRAASLIDFITAIGEVHRQVIVNNFEFLPEESL